MALNFNGNNDLLNCGTDTSLTNLTQSDFTFMAWINAAGWGEGAPPSSANSGRIFNKTGGASSTPWRWNLQQGNQNLTLRVGHSILNGTWNTPSSSIVLNTDQHVGVTWDGNVSNTPVMYINGVSVTVTVGLTPEGTQSSDATDPFIIGNRGAQDRTFNGLIWDARVYDRILRPDEFLSIFTARGKDSIVNGLQARWPLFGDRGASVASQPDVSINQNAGNNNPAAPHADDPNAGHW